MRFYSITVTPPSYAGQGPQIPTNTWTSYPGGKIDPGALQVELDILGSFYGIPGGDVGACSITIHGIPLSGLRQAPNYYGSTVSVSGGFQKGLPLANPSQSGLLVQGTAWQSFSNWVGDDMSLTFVVVPSMYTQANPGNFPFKWVKGQPLSSAIQTALQASFPSPKYKIHMQIASNYATAQTLGHTCYTLTEFSDLIFSYTQTTGPVNIFMWDGVNIWVVDNSVKPQPKNLNFTDLIGQPKWVNYNIMQFMTPMRADIQINTLVKMPQGLPNAPGTVTTTAVSAPSQAKYQSAFQGTFTVQSVRHVGNFRDPDGASWSSIFEAYPNAQ